MTLFLELHVPLAPKTLFGEFDSHLRLIRGFLVLVLKLQFALAMVMSIHFP